jgi:hypothetical protein
VLSIVREKGLLKGKTVAVDGTLLEANAAMKSLVRKDTGEDYKTYLKRLAEEAGLKNPTEEELRRFDRKRPGKKMSNDEWVSRSDPDSRIQKMKDGRTHMSYKAEHVVDLQTEIILAAEVYAGDTGDPASLTESLDAAQGNLTAVDEELVIREAAADKGYHKDETLAACATRKIRTYIPEQKTRGPREWTGKPRAWHEAYSGNRRRCRGERGKKLQRLRSERVERSFAHTCETGGARRSWLRGLEKVRKRYGICAMAHNLGRMMWALFGLGKPRGLQRGLATCFGFSGFPHDAWSFLGRLLRGLGPALDRLRPIRPALAPETRSLSMAA